MGRIIGLMCMPTCAHAPVGMCMCACTHVHGHMGACAHVGVHVKVNNTAVRVFTPIF